MDPYGIMGEAIVRECWFLKSVLKKEPGKDGKKDESAKADGKERFTNDIPTRKVAAYEEKPPAAQKKATRKAAPKPKA